MVKDDGKVTLALVGGPCDGRSVRVDPKDAGKRIEATRFEGRAVVLGADILPRLEAVSMASAWELYERDPADDDGLRYRHVPEDAADMLGAGRPGDEWTWPGWSDGPGSP